MNASDNNIVVKLSISNGPTRGGPLSVGTDTRIFLLINRENLDSPCTHTVLLIEIKLYFGHVCLFKWYYTTLIHDTIL